jgi:hypothetical protein
MKTKIIPIAAIFVTIFILINGCEESEYKIYTGNAPVYMSYEELRSSVAVQQNVDLENPGKIYLKDNYIFIVDELKGIHIYDNANPSSPLKKAFIKLPGVVDISISGNILYADSYVDLVIIDIQDLNNIHEVSRVKEILPYTVPPVDNDYPVASVDEDKGVVTGWEVKTIKERSYDNCCIPYPVYYDKGGDFLAESNASGASSGVSGSGIGAGGSMARFGIRDNILYILTQSEIKILDITNKTSPTLHGSSNYIWGGETMFLSGEYMYIGMSAGMTIYDISIPLEPQQVTFFSHARSCDPVVVDDTLAYITLRSGNRCGGVTNVLNVVNIKDIVNPRLEMSYSMTNPYGLGKYGDLLFVCDGNAGLKIYDASDPKVITANLIKAYGDINAYDVIPMNGLLFLIGDDGLYQYDFSDIMNISLVSSIVAVGTLID